MAEFKQIEENLNALSISSDSEIYDYAGYHGLVDVARTVRGMSVFSGYSTPVYGSIRPFHYQETAVQSMLIDFEGRGVFGDQVGLGKTIEALMTAHIMFRQREIRNMLIVCPSNLVEQWTSEITSKFRDVDGECVFDIKLKKDNRGNWSLRNSVKELKERILEAGDDIPDKLPVFILSTTSLTSPANMKAEKELAQQLEALQNELSLEQNVLESLQNKRVRACDRTNMTAFEREEYDRAVGLAELTGKSIDETYGRLKTLNEDIRTQEEKIGELRKQYEGLKQGSLWEIPLDLLIVDEADTVVSGAVSKKLAGKDVEKADLLLKSLTNLRKKYCILVSATPLRAQLQDIYYLIKIVDENRFSSLESFYSYVGADSLAELVQNEELLKRLNGLINTMFTRARMHDKHVSESYPPEAGCTITRVVSALLGNMQDAKLIWSHPDYPGLSDDQIKQRLEDLRGFVERSIRIYCESGAVEFRQDFVSRIYNVICNSDGPSQVTAGSVNSYIKTVMRGLRDYYFERHDVFIHRYIDWSRQAKDGFCYNIEGSDELQNQKILASLGNAERGKGKVVIFEGKTGSSKTKKDEPADPKTNNRLALYEQLCACFPKRKIFADINDPTFWKRVGGKIDTSDVDDYEDEFYDDESPKGAPDPEDTKEYKAFKRWNIREFSRPDPEYADAIYLIDQTRREGTNLNCASRLIVCQITSGKGDLLDPLRFEQIIGRLNRVGQMENIVIDVYVDNDKEQALYNLYADEEGLDMVRLGKPEVSFVVPIVTEVFRAKRHLKQYSGLRKDSSFTSIFSYCYDHRDSGCLQELRNEIRRLCGILMARNVQEEM